VITAINAMSMNVTCSKSWEWSGTKVITMYLESIRDGRRVFRNFKRVSAKKPVLILKSGRTREGARVSASHTGALQWMIRFFSAACKQAGTIRLENTVIFWITQNFFSSTLPEGNRLGWSPLPEWWGFSHRRRGEIWFIYGKLSPE